MSAAIRTFLITGSPAFTGPITHALLGRAEVRIVGSTAAPRVGGAEVASACPDVVLVDTGLPPAEDLGVVRQVRDGDPRLPIAVGVPDDWAEAALLYLHGGADGYLARGDSAEELVAALRRLRRGETLYSPAVIGALFRRLREGPAGGGQAAGPLSCREREVLRLLAAGLLNKEIASRLGISLCTVKNHIHKVLGKLQATHRRDAVHRACQQGLLDRGALAVRGTRAE